MHEHDMRFREPKGRLFGSGRRAQLTYPEKYYTLDSKSIYQTAADSPTLYRVNTTQSLERLMRACQYADFLAKQVRHKTLKRETLSSRETWIGPWNSSYSLSRTRRLSGWKSLCRMEDRVLTKTKPAIYNRRGSAHRTHLTRVTEPIQTPFVQSAAFFKV